MLLHHISCPDGQLLCEGPCRCRGMNTSLFWAISAIAKLCASLVPSPNQVKVRLIMRQPQWYVIQVQTGREEAMCQLIERVCQEANLQSDEDGYQLIHECFSPQFSTRHKIHGEWVDIQKRLLPGYVIAVTEHSAELAQQLRKIPKLTRLLTMGETFVPLQEEDRQWLEEATHQGDRTVPMSMAYKDGDKIVVTEGPLVGHEGQITRVNRSKCLAFLEFNIGGKKITTQVGLGIVSKADDNTGGRADTGSNSQAEQL